MIVQLSKPYMSRFGVPLITAVDSEIFRTRYYTNCLEFEACNNMCCGYGVDIDIENVKRLKRHKKAIENYAGVPANLWFTNEVEEDDDFPGGSVHRTNTGDLGCIFLLANGQGCSLHSFALEQGMDYHELKPIISCLFPITFCDNTLTVADEVIDKEIECLDVGETLYNGLKNELAYYFGKEFVSELDRLERNYSR